MLLVVGLGLVLLGVDLNGDVIGLKGEDLIGDVIGLLGVDLIVTKSV